MLVSVRIAFILGLVVLAACADTSGGPPPNTSFARFDARQNAVQIETSDLMPPSSIELIAPDGRHIPAQVVTVLSGPDRAAAAGPTVGFGVGGFSSGARGGIGTGVAIGGPIGGPQPTYGSGQFRTISTIPVPSDYFKNWQTFSIRVRYGERTIAIPAPNPLPG